MTREIKFRAWDKTEQKFLDPSIFTIKPNGEIILDGIDNSDIKTSIGISQYTGMNDSNGVEIYEGDILRDPDDGYIIGAVEMDDYFQWVCGGNLLFDCDDCEVIGNVHENVHMLGR